MKVYTFIEDLSTLAVYRCMPALYMFKHNGIHTIYIYVQYIYYIDKHMSKETVIIVIIVAIVVFSSAGLALMLNVAGGRLGYSISGLPVVSRFEFHS